MTRMFRGRICLNGKWVEIQLVTIVFEGLMRFDYELEGVDVGPIMLNLFELPNSDQDLLFHCLH